MIHRFADGSITDTGPLARKRMETIDEAVNARALDLLNRVKPANQAVLFVVEFTSHAHLHSKDESAGKTGLGRARHSDSEVRTMGQTGRDANGCGSWM